MTKIKCGKCGKDLDKSMAIRGYNSYFHKKCYEEFRTHAEKELEQKLKEIL